MKYIKPFLIGPGILVALPVVSIAAFLAWWMAPSVIKPRRPAWVSAKAAPVYDDKQGWHWEQWIDTSDGSVEIVRAPIMYDSSPLAALFVAASADAERTLLLQPPKM